MSEHFQMAVERVLQLKQEPSNVDKLKLYGLFKQATVGDINTDCPSMFNVAGRAKWNAWSENRGKTDDDAKNEYISVVARLGGTNGSPLPPPL